MSNEKRETADDIIAEMRDEGCTGESSCLEWVGAKMRHYADRLEAALKREKAEAEANALAVGGLVEASRATAEKSSAVGDCAKLREALQQAKVAILAARKKMGVDNPIILEIIDAALAAPARNCNVGTAHEQIERWMAFCDRYDADCTGCPCNDAACVSCTDCFARWTQKPYEEGGVK